jgi:D-alanyl-lipoteichoic acid acyltransferase DltB (MBOAT superfamily)
MSAIAVRATSKQTVASTGSLARRDYLLLLVELALVCALVWQFRLEESHRLLTGLLAISGGFAVHAWLPERQRLPFFLALCLGCAALLLGVAPALRIVGVGGSLVAAALAPLTFRARVFLVLGLSGMFVWLRGESTAGFWAVVGSMFMFRMIVYLYSVRHEPTARTPLKTCSYFFLPPNVFFPLFPVVDFKTFCDSYYNEERRRIYQSGVHWIAIGASHLLLYRLIRSELLPEPLAIRTGTSLATFLLMNYALYVRVSGQFHVICGMLHLFGFNLPRTHDCYFLASSYSDIWRRINIYWKDFLTKVFFLPAFFRMRRLGTRLALLLAVLWAFLWTWLGHSWQAFWLLGDFPFRLEDTLLWLGVGSVVAVSALWEYRLASSARRRLRRESLLHSLVHPLRVLFVLMSVSLFWAWWSNPDVVRMLVATRSLIEVTPADVALLTGVLTAACLVGAGRWLLLHSQIGAKEERHLLRQWRNLSFDHSVAAHALPMILLLLLTQPQISTALGAAATGFVEDLRTDRLTEAEALSLVDGYYEQLNEGTRQSGPLLDAPAPLRDRAAVDFSDMIRYRDDLLHHELIPGWRGTWLDSTVTINRWGMRDLERSLVKPAGTCRIAVVGSSFVMGFGVNDDETFCRLLEQRLNEHPPRNSKWRRFEVLNFGVGRCYPVHRRLWIEHKILSFQPDLIVYVAHQDEVYSSAPFIATAVYGGVPLEDHRLEELIDRIGIPEEASEAIHHSLVAEHHVEILRCIYRGMRETCERAGVKLLHAHLPVPGQRELPFDPLLASRIAGEEGIDAFDLTGWWGEHEPQEILIGTQDIHPNQRGHEALADALRPVVERALRGSRAP